MNEDRMDNNNNTMCKNEHRMNENMTDEMHWMGTRI
jgi:hypothetical protein